MRTANRSIILGASLVGGLLLVGGAGSAFGASGDRVGSVVVERYGATISVGNSAGSVHARALPGERVVQGPGAHASAAERLAPARLTVGGARAASGYSCVNNRKRRGFIAYRPTYQTVDRKAIYLQFTYNPYKQNRARTPRGIGVSKQVEMCSAGGAHARGGNHLSRVATDFAPKVGSPKIIGSRWGNKTRGSNISASLGFAVPVGPVTINGSVSVHPQDTFTGSQGPDQDAGKEFDSYHANQVNGLWEGSHLFRFQGSTHYEGNVAHGLWEYPQSSRTPPLLTQTTSRRFCGHFAGIGCA